MAVEYFAHVYLLYIWPISELWMLHCVVYICEIALFLLKTAEKNNMFPYTIGINVIKRVLICWTVMLSTNTKVIGSKLNVCNTINDTCFIVFKRIRKRFFLMFLFSQLFKEILYISCLFVLSIPIPRVVFITTHSWEGGCLHLFYLMLTTFQ